MLWREHDHYSPSHCQIKGNLDNFKDVSFRLGVHGILLAPDNRSLSRKEDIINYKAFCLLAFFNTFIANILPASFPEALRTWNTYTCINIYIYTEYVSAPSTLPYPPLPRTFSNWKFAGPIFSRLVLMASGVMSVSTDCSLERQQYHIVVLQGTSRGKPTSYKRNLLLESKFHLESTWTHWLLKQHSSITCCAYLFFILFLLLPVRWALVPIGTVWLIQRIINGEHIRHDC